MIYNNYFNPLPLGKYFNITVNKQGITTMDNLRTGIIPNLTLILQQCTLFFDTTICFSMTATSSISSNREKNHVRRRCVILLPLPLSNHKVEKHLQDEINILKKSILIILYTRG